MLRATTEDGAKLCRPDLLDDLERVAVEALTRMYGRQPRTARFRMQKGIEGMRLAVAEAMERGEC